MKLGIDVGGTKTKVAVLDEHNELVTTESYPTVIHDGPFLRSITQTIQEKLVQWPKISQVGIGIPGTVDTDSGVVVWSPALQIEDLALCHTLQKSIALPIYIDNDVNAWALAERTVGSCRNDKNYVLLTVGTGIGAGIVINGEIYRGSNFCAGEIGYMVESSDYSSPCPTKKDFGAFERRASAVAVSDLYREETGETVDTQEIYRRAHDQSPDLIAKEIIDRQIDALAVGISNIICILQPSKIVIGGGLANEGEALIHQLSSRVKRLIPLDAPIVLSEGGKWGGAIGAALIASS